MPCGGATYGTSNLLFIANDWHAALLPVYLQVGGGLVEAQHALFGRPAVLLCHLSVLHYLTRAHQYLLVWCLPVAGVHAAPAQMRRKKSSAKASTGKGCASGICHSTGPLPGAIASPMGTISKPL